MSKKRHVFENLILDEYEQEIEDSIPEDYGGRGLSDDKIREFSELAHKHKFLTQTKRINIRVKNRDLLKIKARAKESNMPYQTLLGALIHKFAIGDSRVSI